MSRPLGDVLATAWGAAYALWGGLKLFYGLMTPTLCTPHPIAGYAMLAAAIELVVGLCVCSADTRRKGGIVGMAFNLGLIAAAFIADARSLPWEGCGCVFVGVEFPWLPGHAILAGALTLPFLAIVVRSERQLRQAGRSAA